MTAKPRVYLLDVEGTIAPISLVSEQLFPYARANFAEFLKVHWMDAAVAADLDLLAEGNREEKEASCPRFVRAADRHSWEDALRYLLWLMDRDRKSTALKSLQGKIWKSGFESGELRGMLFPDVPPALERWSAHARIAIYSSGSVDAQKLLFRYSTFGNLSALISDYFDTKTGAKTSPESYCVIAAAMKVSPQEVCFFSDVVRELDPARQAGMATHLVIREGNAPIDDSHGHLVINSFDSVL